MQKFHCLKLLPKKHGLYIMYSSQFLWRVIDQKSSSDKLRNSPKMSGSYSSIHMSALNSLTIPIRPYLILFPLFLANLLLTAQENIISLIPAAATILHLTTY